ncbi:MAG: GDSL-type esterase/lipase family protein, partial [Planctomycetota bacterium]
MSVHGFSDSYTYGLGQVFALPQVGMLWQPPARSPSLDSHMLSRCCCITLMSLLLGNGSTWAKDAPSLPRYQEISFGTGREVMDLYLPDCDQPAPVFVFGHAKGQTVKHVPRRTISKLLQARMAFVSIEANDPLNDKRQEIHDPKTWDRAISFLNQNADRFGLDMKNLFVGGRSLGSIGAFPFAMQNPHRVRGVFCSQAIPDRGELFAPLVTKHAPPCRFVFKTNIGSLDHDPSNGIAIRDAYSKLGIGDRFRMKMGVGVEHWYDDLHEFIARHRSGPIADYDPNRFAGAVAAFAKQDKRNGVPKNGILFVGSSSIARMDAPVAFPNHPLTARGLRGGQVSDLNHHFDQLVRKYQPGRVVFFCGGNDLWVGHTPEEVLEDVQQFVTRLHYELPQCELIQLAIRPSPKKRSIIDRVLRANKLLEEFAAKDDRITFLRGSCDRQRTDRGWVPGFDPET